MTGSRHRPSVRWARELLTLVVAALVAGVSALLAHGFREAGLGALHALSGRDQPIEAAEHLGPVVTFLVVAVAALAAAVAGHRAALRWGNRLGLTAVAATARADAPMPGVRGTLVRGASTWVASASMLSVGRESALLEGGGLLGAQAGRITGHRRAIAAAGVTAAFTAAYHAPVGALLYVIEHLGVRGRPRGTTCGVIGVVVSHQLLTRIIDVGPLFPSPTAGRVDSLVLALIVVVPATLASRTMLAARETWAVAAADRLPSAVRIGVGALLTAALVAIVPEAAGNGMEGLRVAADHPTAAVGAALAVGKLTATTAALAAGVPGGAFSPTMATAGGTALLTTLALGGLGVDLPGAAWDAILPAMVVAVAVGLRAPFTAMIAVPEMAGSYGYVPVAAAVVGLAVLVDRRLPGAPSAAVHDEDA